MVAGLSLALVAVLGVEVYLAATAPYLPGDPGLEVQATVGPTSAATPVELVVLGDSTVMGIGSPTLEQSLPVLVAERVASRLSRPVHVVAMGASGARTATVLERQVPLLEGSEPDAVLVVVGSNDVTHVTAPWTMRRQSTALVEAVRKAGHAPVVIGGIPQFRTVPALLQPLRWVTGRYASVLRGVQRQATTQAGAAYVDIAALASPRFIGRPESMSSDGYHPSPVGYGFWADALAPTVADAVSGARAACCSSGSGLYPWT
ncbi:MAG: SGNH/GDSL hydrolase family protein [Egibacteraceae bacterium]